MMKKSLLIITTVLLGVKTTFGGLNFAPADSSGYTPKMYVGILGGSFGAGLQFAYPLTPMITLRTTGSYLPAIQRTFTGTEDGAVTTTDVRFQTGGGGIISDFSFFANRPGIRLSAGFFYNSTKTTLTRSYYLESEAIDLGTLTMVFTPKLNVNPYLGVVFGNLKNSKRVFFSMEMGMLYQGKPQLEFTGEGHVAPTANESNTSVIEKNIQSVQVFPYMNLQLNFKL